MVPDVSHVIPHSRPWIDDADRAAVNSVLASGMIARGVQVAAFEHELGESLGFAAGVATSSGTRALFCALQALGVSGGDEVVIPTYVCAAVRDAVVATGATPRLCDVGVDWCVTTESIERALSGRTRAVVVVHTFGIPVEPEIQRRVGVPGVDDCCQAIGLSPGALSGAASVVSFHATKMLTTGEGGMVFSHDPALLERMRRWSTTDRDQMSDLQAALGRSQLRRYPEFLSRRRELAARYVEALAQLPIRLPSDLLGRSLFFRFPVRTSGDFEQLRQTFAQAGVQVRRGVDALLHRDANLNPADFPNAERMFKETLSLPLYPSLTEAEAGRVIAAATGVLSPLAKA
jgi:UDP-4-amino-4-deoxy-L-arabinose-oxoglutarate aminotransferase